ncbi:hypothetical protein H6G36_22640 [Anabaena minutissima FACHB-250]|nr:hypothetical protein [Anabaena minutissima FACHB-250]
MTIDPYLTYYSALAKSTRHSLLTTQHSASAKRRATANTTQHSFIHWKELLSCF